MRHPLPHRRPRAARPAALAVLALAAACGVDAAPSPPSAPPQAFDAERAWRDLERVVAFGPRPAGSERLDALRDHLVAELAALGLDPVRERFTDTTPIGPIEFENVYADVVGTATEDGAEPPIVVLAAHIDTKRLPFEFVGANDGGSGTAALLELARALAPTAGTRPVTVRLLFLDGEEAVRPEWADPDNRYGSRHHVARLQETGEAERVGAVVVLDLVADEHLRFHRDTNSHPELLELLFDAARRQGLGRHVDGPREAILDDHLSFRKAGIPAADLIDLRYGPDHGSNAYWHSPEDTLEHCSARSLGVTGRIVLAALPAIEAWVLARR